MALGPCCIRRIGVPGMFELTGVLALAAMGVVYAVIPIHGRVISIPMPDRALRACVTCCTTANCCAEFRYFRPARLANAMFVVIPFAAAGRRRPARGAALENLPAGDAGRIRFHGAGNHLWRKKGEG